MKRIPWNKGNGSYMEGSKNHFFGRHHTKESKEKNRIAHIGKKPNEKQLAGLAYGRILKKGISAPWAKNLPQSFKKGEQHINWKGGCSSWRGKNWKKICKSILIRDNFRCVECSCTKNLSVHHIIPWRVMKNNSESNLVALCKKCHFIADLKYTNMEKIMKYAQDKLGVAP